MRKPMIRRMAAVFLLVCLTAGLPVPALADDAPSIVGDLPGSLRTPAETAFTLTVAAAGEELQYQWYKNDEPLEGQTASSYTVASASGADSGAYYCYVQNAAGGAASGVCQVLILEKPVLTQDVNITSMTLNPGDIITLTAAAEGENLLTQWYCRKGEEVRELTGQTGPTLSLTASEEYNDADFYCQFVNEAGGTVTSFCRITVNPAPTPTPAPEAPKVTKDPTGETVETGGRAIFIARAEGVTSYVWRFINPSGGASYDYNNLGSMFPGLTVSGGDTDTITLNNIPYELNDWRVACLFRGEGGETLSGEARIQVNRAVSTLSIIAQPVGGTMAIDENPEFLLSIQASASDGGSFSYQWFSSETNSSASMRPISGATYATYKPERKEGTTYYRVGVSLTANGRTGDPYYSNTVAVTFTAKKAHEHSYSTAWEHNDISHWHQCTCGDHADEERHSYEWTELKRSTATEDGQQKGVCTVCGYETIQPIPAGSQPELTPTPAPSAGSGVSVWLFVLLGALAVLVIAGAAYLVIRVLRSDEEEDEDDPGDTEDE